jgi:protein-tyrosine phosphatase
MLHAEPMNSEDGILTMVDEIAAIVNQFSDSKILIFCDDGCSYSPTVTIAYLMKKERWSYFDAFTFVRDRHYR